MTREIFKKYIVALLKNVYVRVVFIFEVFATIGIYAGWDNTIGSQLALLILGITFFIANVIVYKDMQIALIASKEAHKDEVLQLSNEIAELKNVRPVLNASFYVDGKPSTFETIIVPQIVELPDINEMVRQEDTELQKIYKEKLSLYPNNMSVGAYMDAGMTLNELPTTKDRYKQECYEYLAEYRNYLSWLHSHQEYVARYRELDFLVKNTGHVQANGIVLVMHFPEGFIVRRAQEDDEEHLVLITKPTPPKRPSTELSLFSNSLMEHISVFDTPSHEISTPELKGPFISGTQIRYEISGLLHNLEEKDLNPLGFSITDNAIGHRWEIKYEIHAQELPKPIKGSWYLEIKESI